MNPRQPVPSSRRSWREHPAGGELAPRRGSKTPRRVFVTLLVIGLFAGFAWLLLRLVQKEPRTHFIALLTHNSDALWTPPILFEQATVEPLEQLSRSGQSCTFHSAAISQLAGSESIKALLDKASIQPSDRVVVYVSAHGSSDRQQPVILGTDAPDQNETGSKQQYYAAELIAALHGVKAATKLLVLDCSRLATAPRLGLVANEFNGLVEKVARSANDPDLWVLVAGGDLETSPLGLAERKSILGVALVEALQSGGDELNGGNGDRELSLEELNSFVERRCAASKVAAPHPRLIYCGKNPSSERRSERIVSLLPRSPNTPSENDTKPPATPKASTSAARPPGLHAGWPSLTLVSNETAAPAAAPPANGPGPAPTTAATNPAAAQASSPAAPANPAEAGGAPLADGEKASAKPPASAPGSEAAPQQPPPAPPPAPVSPPAAPPEGRTATSPIIRIWRRRDELAQGRSIGGLQIQPVHYAPQLWCELNAKLVHSHLMELQDPESDFRTADKLLDELEGKLEAAYQDFASHGASWLQAPADPYVQALLDLRRFACQANDYVQWHASLVACGPNASGTTSTARAIERTLNSLIALDQQLHLIEDEAAASDDAYGRRIKEIGALVEKIESELTQLAANFNAVVNNAFKKPDPAAQRLLEIVLSSPLANADQRRRALAAIAQASRPQQAPAPSELHAWSDVADQLKLQLLLVEFASPQWPDLQKYQGLLGKFHWTTRPAETDQRQFLLDAGKSILDFYKHIPQAAKADDADVRQVEKLLAIIHPRDAALSLAGLDRTTAYVKPHMGPRAELALSPPKDVVLVAGRWTPLIYPAQRKHLDGAPITVTVEYDAQSLKMRSVSGEDIASGASRTFGSDEPLAFEVWASPAEGRRQDRGRTIKLTASAVVGSRQLHEQTEVELLLPGIDRLQLSAYSVEPEQDQRPAGDDGVTLEPFPGRTTTFKFKLKNLSDDDKDLRLEWRALPPSSVVLKGADGGWPTGRLFNSAAIAPAIAQWAGSNLEQAKLIAVADVSLKPNQQSQLQLTAPASPAGSDSATAPPAAPAAGAAPPPPEAAVPSIDVSHGLVCRVVDKARPNEPPRLFWIEVVPQRPAAYLDFASRMTGGRISITAAPRRLDGQMMMPPGVAAQPLQIIPYSRNPQIPTIAAQPALLSAGADEATLILDVAGELTTPAELSVQVDGWPRACRWLCQAPRDPVENHSALVRFVSLGMKHATDPKQSKLFRLGELAGDQSPDPEWPLILPGGAADHSLCAFDVSQGMGALEMRLQVDGPLDAFNTADDSDSVSIAWEGQQPTEQLYDDRAIQSQLTAVTPEGALAIHMTAADFKLPLAPPPGIRAGVIKLQAHLTAPRQSASDELRVIFDDRPPEIVSLTPTSHVFEIDDGAPPETARPFRATLGVQDVSGVAKVEAWFVEKVPPSSAALTPDGAVLSRDVTERHFGLDGRQSIDVLLSPSKSDGMFVFRVTDGSGQTASTLATPLVVHIRKRPPPPKEEVIGDLKGVVKLAPLGRAAPAGLVVTATDKKTTTRTARTAAGGAFTIPKLKAGAYTIEVSGLAGSTPVVSEPLEISLTTKEDYKEVLTITASLQRTPPKQPAAAK